MQEDLFLLENNFVRNFSKEMKREIIVLYKLGVSIDEIGYLTKIKFGRKIKINELINFLFSYV